MCDSRAYQVLGKCLLHKRVGSHIPSWTPLIPVRVVPLRLLLDCGKRGCFSGQEPMEVQLEPERHTHSHSKCPAQDRADGLVMDVAQGRPLSSAALIQPLPNGFSKSFLGSHFPQVHGGKKTPLVNVGLSNTDTR